MSRNRQSLHRQLHAEVTGTERLHEDWPWDWDFRNNCRYVDRQPDEQTFDEPEIEELEHRGRSLRRKTSNASLLSVCLSEASEQHEFEAASRSSSMGSSFERSASPFRPESPHAPSSPFQRETSYGNPMLVSLNQVQNRRYSSSRSRADETSPSTTEDYIRPIQSPPYLTRLDDNMINPYESTTLPQRGSVWGFVNAASPACDTKFRKRKLSRSESIEDVGAPLKMNQNWKRLSANQDTFQQTKEGRDSERSLGDLICPGCHQNLEFLRYPYFNSYLEKTTENGHDVLACVVRSKCTKNLHMSLEPIPQTMTPQRLNFKEPTDRALELSKNIADTPSLWIRNDNHGNTSESSSKFVTCNICRKFTGRPCDLKKHMRRHQRPYGCTFSGCVKRFGSKNDWKRHETSQHLTSSGWKCDILSGYMKTPCGELFSESSKYFQHLRSIHSLNDSEIILQKRERKSIILYNPLAKFWCGFCRISIDMSKKKDRIVAGDRFDHIDHHFIQEGKKIEMWMPQTLENMQRRPPSPVLATDTFNQA